MKRGVLLLKPPRAVGTLHAVTPILGLGYLASVLREKGYRVNIFDGLNTPSWEKFISMIADYDIFGIQVFPSEISILKDTVETIKERKKEGTIIVGGALASSFPKYLLENMPSIDFVVIGEGELTISYLDKLLNKENLSSIPNLCWRDGNKIQINSREYIKDLDEIPYPAWDLINPNNYPCAPLSFSAKKEKIAPVIFSRGCFFKCTFCASKLIMGSRVRYRSPQNLFNEILKIYSDFNIEEFHFMDDNLAFDKYKLQEFCRLIINKGLKIYLNATVGIRVETIDIETLKLMEKAGFYAVGVGVESGSEEVLKQMKKGITLEKLKEKIKLIKNSTNMKITAFFMFGLPYEKPAHRFQTIKCACSLPVDKILFSIFNPAPGSELYYSIFKSDFPPKRILELDFHTFSYVSGFFNVWQIRILRIISYMIFYLRPHILKNIISDVRSPFQMKMLMIRIYKALFK